MLDEGEDLPGCELSPGSSWKRRRQGRCPLSCHAKIELVTATAGISERQCLRVLRLDPLRQRAAVLCKSFDHAMLLTLLLWIVSWCGAVAMAAAPIQGIVASSLAGSGGTTPEQIGVRACRRKSRSMREYLRPRQGRESRLQTGAGQDQLRVADIHSQ